MSDRSISSRITEFHHFTMPVKDLASAEEFYTRVFGAEVTRRLGNHISVVLGTGPRIDLFLQDEIVAPKTLHPHFAWIMSPDDLYGCPTLLEKLGVPYDGPHGSGPPGTRNIYVTDPFGNRLELVAHGCDDQKHPYT
jgi:catechol 2,3-dioxygenase-like lactoylglutathione lyase family enzyme